MGDNPDRSEQVAALEERLEDVVETVEQQAEKIDALEDDLEKERERRRALEDENDELRGRVADLEDELESRAAIKWDSSDAIDATLESTTGTMYPLGPKLNNTVSEYDLEEELEQLRDRLADGDLVDEDEPAESTGPTVVAETPLEQVVDLPEAVAETELSENQQRARFIASDVRSYASKAQAGYVMDAGEVSRVLAAGTDTTPHSETVRRVMSILEDLGDDDVDVVKRRGKKRVVFTKAIVRRVERITDEAHAVVSPSEA